MRSDAAIETSLPADFEEYHVVRLLGRGAMGEVFLAHDTALDRPVAIKLASGAQTGPLAPAGGRSPDAAAAAGGRSPDAVRERFFAEARALARVRHPNVIAIHRVGEVRGRPYLVTEYVAGESLDSMVGPAPEAALLGIARGLAAALAAVHGAGVIHRDVKPSNVVLGDGGAVKLIDFGVAEAISSGGERACSGQGRALAWAPPPPPSAGVDLTISLPVTQIVEPCSAASPSLARSAPPGEQAPSTPCDRMAGTPLYMAPELWAGAKASARTDIYSLGVTLYRLAIGEALFARVPWGRLAGAKVGSRPAAVSSAGPGLSPAFAAVIERAMARSPEERYPSADALLSALLSLANVSSDKRSRARQRSRRLSSQGAAKPGPRAAPRLRAHFEYPTASPPQGAPGGARLRCAP